jgi:ketosteroid isomerase-like protein
VWIALCVIELRSLETDVIARFVIAVVLLNSSPLKAQMAPASPPLESAERALVNALLRPDSDAFRQLIAEDAVFLLPSEARGPEAIVEKWRPFLSGTDARMALTIENSTTAGNTGQTSGSLAVYARTTKGMSTTPVGGFFIDWRLVDGQWKIGSLTRGSSPRVRG